MDYAVPTCSNISPAAGKEAFPRSATAVVRFSLSEGAAEGYFQIAGCSDALAPFRGLDDLVLRLEAELERREPRKDALRSLPGYARGEEPDAYMPVVRLRHAVSIRVYYRQHFSMQGELCIQGGRRVFFRSALELLRLLRQLTEQIAGKEV